MDKKLNRQIGYVKPATLKSKLYAAGIKPKKEEKAPTSEEVIRQKKTKKVIAWLKAHPMFAWSRMCVLMDINKGNFSQTLKSKTPYISLESIAKIEHVISDYGYEK